MRRRFIKHGRQQKTTIVYLLNNLVALLAAAAAAVVVVFLKVVILGVRARAGEFRACQQQLAANNSFEQLS